MEQDIITLASEVREWAEDFAFSEEAKMFDFYEQNDLNCMCAFSSTVLFYWLKKHKIQNIIAHSNECHVFLTYKNDAILDITATQVSKKFSKVELSSFSDIIKKSDKGNWWKIEDYFFSVEEMYEALTPRNENGFPDTQYWKSWKSLQRTLIQADRWISTHLRS